MKRDGRWVTINGNHVFIARDEMSEEEKIRYDLGLPAKDVSRYNSRNIGRNMANGNRRSKFHKLTEEEKKYVIEEAKAIGIDESKLVFDSAKQTQYDDESDKIYVGGDILPSEDDSPIARDRMSVRAVLAHEYWGHGSYNKTNLPKGSQIDEFRASYTAAVKSPNLSDEDRQLLMRDAYDRAAETGKKVKLSDDARRILYGF